MLLERESELGVLDDLVAELDTTGGKVVLVRGEAGIGKSSLVREFIRRHADDAHLYFGACDDLLTPQLLGPLRDIAREEQRLIGPLADGDRSVVLATSLDLLSGSLRPNIMVFEDTHWADEATLDVIKYLGRRIARTNGLLLLTYRDGEVDYDHPLRQVIGELPPENLVRMQLGNLSPNAISDLVGDADVDVDKILTLTDGNPLFVTEVLSFGVEAVPVSVRDSVLARAAKLSADARRILELVSVIPGETERTLIDSILRPTEEQMTECVRQDLLQVERHAAFFHHELTRQAVESALAPGDRRRLNQHVLEELAEGEDLSRLVHHAREANDVEAIIRYAPRAARAAIGIDSHREAGAHFRTLEPHLDRIGEAERATIVEDWARNEFNLDDIEANEILDRAVDLYRSCGDDIGLARALTFAVRVYEISGRPESAEAASLEAISILESYPSSADFAAAIGQRAWLLLMKGDRERALVTAERAIKLAEAAGDELSLIYALNTKGFQMYAGGDSDGFRFLEEALTRAERGKYQFEEIRALINMTTVLADVRELDRAKDFGRRACDTASRYENRLLENGALANYSEVLLWRGEWAMAENAAFETFDSGVLYNQVIAGRVIGRLQARQGRPEAQATLGRTWEWAEEADELQTILPTAAALAELMWLEDMVDSDRTARFRTALEDSIQVGDSWIAGDLAFWLWKLGELSDVPEGIAEPYQLVINGKPIEAAAIWETKGIPYERAAALMHGDETRRLEALEIFETLGATLVASKLRKGLRNDGVAVPRGKDRDTRRHAAGLTVRQAEVLHLLDEGLTNIEIADRLFVSPRTVENHVSAVLTKLDSSTRDEAVFRARDEGLLSTQF